MHFVLILALDKNVVQTLSLEDVITVGIAL